VQAEIIAIGSELLIGGRSETNSLFLTEALVPLGIEVRYKTVVGDRERDIEEAVRRALSRSQVILTTGGLGPTDDDITKKVISKVTQRRLVLREEILKKIAKQYGGLKRPMPKRAERQALIPSQAAVIVNPVGTAPGFILTHEEPRLSGHDRQAGDRPVYLIVLPGVPYEMERMFSESVTKFLENVVGPSPGICLKTVRSYGLSESKVNELIKDLFLANKAVQLGLLASPSGVDVRIQISGKRAEEAEMLSQEVVGLLKERLGDHIYGMDQTTMEAVVGGLLKAQRITLAVAESCTGGLIGHRLTSIPGSSDYLDRVLVCYSNRSKMELLGVPARTLREHGAVSAAAVTAMAEGLLKAGSVHLALAVTGIAGPTGGTREKPVGLVYIGLASTGLPIGGQRGESHCRFHHFAGGRDTIKFQASQMALETMRRWLLGIKT
jgi:competence/damage-inducible protein CinA-like protein